MTVEAIRNIDTVVDFLADAGERDRRSSGVAVTIRQLRKSFGRHEILRGIDLHIRAGEFLAIVGRSGCGKSTLLRMLLGLEQPSGGHFEFGDAIDRTAQCGAVRIMFQEPRLLPWATVLGNVEVGLGKERGSREGHQRAIDTLREVGLEDRRYHWPSVLSGGQKQRVALARALVSRPRLLALDEPLGALDALTRISMQRLIERVWLDQTFTAIMVTHDVAEAVALADRLVIIEDGFVALDQRIHLPRPRERGSPEVAALEGRILRALLRNARPGEDR